MDVALSSFYENWKTSFYENWKMERLMFQIANFFGIFDMRTISAKPLPTKRSILTVEQIKHANKLRWTKKWTLAKLADYYRVSTATIYHVTTDDAYIS